MKLYKYHGLGNDYLVLDTTYLNNLPSKSQIKSICDRHYGIGADGLLVGPYFNSNLNRLELRIFNPDGNEAEKSGNGIRIFAAFLKDMDYVSSDTATIYTKGGEVHVNYINNNSCHCQVYMGDAIAGPINTACSFGSYVYNITCVDIGNPHCVIPLVNISSGLIQELGPVITKSSIFPHGINLQLMKVIDSGHIQIEIYERGAGYTLSSGTSSCAAAYASHILGLTDSVIDVIMPGGTLKVEIKGSSIYLTGLVEYIASSEIKDVLEA